jgi:hypothetical protein
MRYWIEIWGLDSADGVATRYGLDGPGIECRRGEILLARSDRAWGLSRLIYNGCRIFSDGKATGTWR